MESKDDLGFEFKPRKNGAVDVFHHGRKASTLRGKDAASFLAKAEGASFAKIQQLLARVTGNYKRGNERVAASHAKNRRD